MLNRESKKRIEINNSKFPSINSQLIVAYTVFKLNSCLLAKRKDSLGCIVATIQQFTKRLDNYS